jgi:hypothetical protein
MTRLLGAIIRRDAGGRCEYCGIPEVPFGLPHVLDHILARQHGGKTEPKNLALACGQCNLHKGPNLSGVDPATRRLTRLFNPRKDHWAKHFRYDQAILIGLTPIGRATVIVLAINKRTRVAARQAFIATGIKF